LLPGLVDIHCHGGSGGELGEHAASGRLGVDHHHRSGTTSLIGSLVSNTSAALVGGAANCAALVAHDDLAGIHLEGRSCRWIAVMPRALPHSATSTRA